LVQILTFMLPFQNRTFIALKGAESQLDVGQGTVDMAHKLIDESKDILAEFLDEQASLLAMSDYLI